MIQYGGLMLADAGQDHFLLNCPFASDVFDTAFLPGIVSIHLKKKY